MSDTALFFLTHQNLCCAVPCLQQQPYHFNHPKRSRYICDLILLRFLPIFPFSHIITKRQTHISNGYLFVIKRLLFLFSSWTWPVKRMAASSSFSSANGFEEDSEEEIPHVLAVDDSLVDRKLIERLLTNSACKVTTAENGQRALEFLGLLQDGQQGMNNLGSKVHLIITDYCMPGMSGYELLKKVKESSNLSKIPVVIVSSENVPTRIKKCLDEGAQEFMLKPLKQSDIKKLRCHMTNFDQPCNGRLCMGR